MLWYVLLLCPILIVGIFSCFSRKNEKRSSKRSFFFCCAILFFFAALRSVNVGADTRQYQWVFKWVGEMQFSQIPFAQSDVYYSEGQELFYKYYNKVISFFSQDVQAITIVNSLLLMTLVAILILLYSPDYWMSIFLFFTMGFYQTALNLTPSSIASYLGMISIRFAQKKKPVPYFITVGIASLFHNSAIVFFPLYFLSKIEITQKKFWGIIFVSFAVMTAFFEQIISFMSYIMPVKYLPYLAEGRGLVEQMMVWGSHIVIFIFCWIIASLTNKNTVINSQDAFLFIIMETVFYFGGLHLSVFSRGAFLFSPYLIVAIPTLLHNILSLDNLSKQSFQYIRPYKSLGQNRLQRLAKLVVIVSSVIIYIARISINNIGQTMPYTFFWG